MSRRIKALCWWVAGNLTLLFGLPALTGWFLEREMDEQYRTGVGISTDGDSIGIPIGEVAIMTAVALLIVDVIALLVWIALTLWHKRRRQRA